MSQSFRELLSQSSDQIERPRALADGHYIGKITGHEFGQSRQRQTAYVRFVLVPEEATGDVEVGANEGIDLSRKELRKDFYITPSAIYRLSDMLDAVLGEQIGVPLDQRIPETRGASVMFQVGHRNSDDGKEVYNEIGTIVKA